MAHSFIKNKHQILGIGNTIIMWKVPRNRIQENPR